MVTVIVKDWERDYSQTLRAFRVASSPARIMILKIITENFPSGFSVFHLLQEVEKQNVQVNSATVISTIGMFRIRGLVVEIPQSESETKLICALNQNQKR